MLVVHAAQSELEAMRSLAGSATEDPSWNDDDDDLENVDDLPPTPCASSSPLASAVPTKHAKPSSLVRKRKTSLEPFDDPDGILAKDALINGTQAPPLAPSLAPLENLDSASVPELVDLLLGSDRQAGKTDSTNKICALLITHPDVQNHPEALRHCKCRDGETAHVKYSKCVC